MRETWWRRLAREPLLYFLLAGLVLFGLAEQHRRTTDHYRIAITPARIAGLRNAYQAEFGSPPKPAMMPRLIDDYVASEVLFREGIARGLDQDDEIIRRRVIQKVEFLEQDMAMTPAPSDAQLRGWYAKNRARYGEPGSVSFTHLFFAADAGNEAASKARALAVLPRLSSTIPPIMEWGDSFPDRTELSHFSPSEARRLFGDGELARQLFASPVGQWSGPWRSSWGWHLVRVSAAEPGGVRPYDAVREAVAADFARAAREAENKRRLAALRARYNVVRE